MTNLGRVLVTGSTGRIGKEVVARLSQAGLATVRASLHSPSKQAYLESLGAKEVGWKIRASAWERCPVMHYASGTPRRQNWSLII